MPLIEGARFGHLNVTTSDWRSLAAFYQTVFGMDIVPPERDFRSPDLDRATGLTDAHLRGAHLRLPGEADGGPTLEIFEYDDLETQRPPAVDRPGLGSHRVPGPRCRRGARRDARRRRLGGRRRRDVHDRRWPPRDLVLRRGPGRQHRRAPDLALTRARARRTRRRTAPRGTSRRVP